MKILVTGQCSLHQGRLENGNIGNYYISETSFRELHRVFPDAEIVTTMQFSEAFCKKENVKCIPMEYFYAWDEEDVSLAIKEYGIAELYSRTNYIYEHTGYIDQVLKSDLVIDFSGELWGDHSEPVGHNRFIVGLLKLRTAQLLGVKTALLASSEGPFSDKQTMHFAQEVYRNYDVICNREAASKVLLEENGFDTSKTYSYACPAFLFEPASAKEVTNIIHRDSLFSTTKPNVGFILCGFNFEEGPYDKFPRADKEFVKFAEAVEYMVAQLDAHVLLMSHQNGFEKNPFKLIQGRDYPIIKQLHDVLQIRGNIDMRNVVLPPYPYNPWLTKGIISQLDILVTGRVHGYVAGISSLVPTVLVNRGFGIPSHRNIGFARVVGMEHLIADPHSASDMIKKVEYCFQNRVDIKRQLTDKVPMIQQQAHDAFDKLRELFQ